MSPTIQPTPPWPSCVTVTDTYWQCRAHAEGYHAGGSSDPGLVWSDAVDHLDAEHYGWRTLPTPPDDRDAPTPPLVGSVARRPDHSDRRNPMNPDDLTHDPVVLPAYHYEASFTRVGSDDGPLRATATGTQAFVTRMAQATADAFEEEVSR